MISYWGIDHGADIIAKGSAKSMMSEHSAYLVGAGVGGGLSGLGAHHIMRASDSNFQKTVSHPKNRKKYVGAAAGVGAGTGLMAAGPAGALGGGLGAGGAAAFATRKKRGRRAVQE